MDSGLPMEILAGVKDFLLGNDVPNRLLVKEYKATFSLLAFYILFVKWLGPALMKPYKPMDLRNTIRAYNFFQVIANFFMVIQLIRKTVELWPVSCNIRYNPNYPQIIENSYLIIWHLYLLKVSDLLDTVFFVLRKKQGHISFLHVFHHALMVVLFWIGISKLVIGFFIGLALTINTFIHVVMYFYYFLAAFGPQMQKYLWWKRYLTQMQITQFVIILVYMTWGFITGCEPLEKFEVSCYIFIFSLLVLFLNFYFKSFKTKKN